MKLLDEFNIDNVCWESDFPHSDSSWPYAPEVARGAASPALDDAKINKITHENAMRHYQLRPVRHPPAEQCTVAALRAEAPDVDVVTHVGRPADESDRSYFQ